jgi:hypothetical protein
VRWLCCGLCSPSSWSCAQCVCCCYILRFFDIHVAVARCPLPEMPANKGSSQKRSVAWAFVPSRPWDISLVGAASVAFAAVWWWLLMSKSTDTTTSSSARSSKPIDFVPLFDAPFDRLKHFSGVEGVPVYKAVAQVLPLEQTGELMKFIQKFAAEKGWAMYSR